MMKIYKQFIIIMTVICISNSIAQQPSDNILSEQVTKKTTQAQVEHTLAIIKPEAVKEGHSGDIIRFIELNGFKIKKIKKLKLKPKAAAKFYKVHKGKPFFKNLVNYMSSGSIIVLVLQKQHAIADWRELMGVTNPAKARIGTIRKMFGTSLEKNAVHGSDAPQSAKEEIDFFF